jgi:hypothetical protein
MTTDGKIMNVFWKKNWPVVPLVLLVLGASLVSLAESFHGLRNWAMAHGVNRGWTADFWPLQVDVFIVAGELGLLLSAFYRWPKRVRGLCWTITVVGLVVSVAANSFQELGPAADWTFHLTAAVPPIAATSGLLVILSITKQFAAPEAESSMETVAKLQRVEGPDKKAKAVTDGVKPALEAPKRYAPGVEHAKFSEALKVYRESLNAPGKTISERDLMDAIGMPGANRGLARFVKAYVAEGRTDAG